MAYEKTSWKARQGTNRNKFTKSGETEQSVILSNAPDSITEPGTPFSVENMNHIERGIEEAHELAEEAARAGMSTHAETVDGAGRNLLDVFGVSTIPEAVEELRRRCNNDGQIDDSGIPDFRGLMVGDYIDGLDLSGIPAPDGGEAPQPWNDTYKNNRILVSGFNTFKDGEANTENHVLFTFRNIVAQCPVCAARDWLTYEFTPGLNEALGYYLYGIEKRMYNGSPYGYLPSHHVVWLPSEAEVFGDSLYGYEDNNGRYIHLPPYRDGYAYRIKRWDGVPRPWLTSTPFNREGDFYVIVTGTGHYYIYSGSEAGISPVFCIA